MIMATHDVELVPLFCDRVAIMSNGRLIEEKAPQEVFADIDMIRNAELRLPRIAHLIEILKKEDGLYFAGMPLTIAQARQELLKLKGDWRSDRPEVTHMLYSEENQ
jgi:cobalt/nickel transport system ATP-binding protein